MKIKFTLMAVLALLTSACAQVQQIEEFPQPEELVGAAVPMIRMAVDPKSGDFRIQSKPTAECRKAGQAVDGCFEVGRNKVVFASFELDNSPDWQLQRFKICLGESKPSENCNLTPWNRLEFIAAKNRNSDYLVPDKEGVIELVLLGKGLERFYLATQNLYEQWWYYQVQVCPAGSPPGTPIDDAACRWNIDPPIKNRGRGMLR